MATPYRLYYWAIPGRGEFIRQLLEYVGAPYEDVAQGPEGVSAVAALRSGTLAGCPHFAPPILQVSETLSLSQTPVISAYIAKMHGLMPDGEGKEYIAMQIDHTVQDVVTEVRSWQKLSWRLDVSSFRDVGQTLTCTSGYGYCYFL